MRSLISCIRQYGYYDHYGDRFRFFLGDFTRWDEEQSGSRKGPEIGFTVDFYDHTGEFDENLWVPDTESQSYYLSHYVDARIWRWSISLTLRGREISRDWGDLPDWDE